MQRRDFISAATLAVGGFMFPIRGYAVAAEVLSTKLDVARNKLLADAALAAAT